MASNEITIKSKKQSLANSARKSSRQNLTQEGVKENTIVSKGK